MCINMVYDLLGYANVELRSYIMAKLYFPIVINSKLCIN